MAVAVDSVADPGYHLSMPIRSVLLAAALLGSVVSCRLWSSDELEREVARHDAEVAKAQQVFDDAVASANDKALKVYVRIAQRQAKAGDVPGATASWKEVLRLQRMHAEARAFFTSLNILDDVIAELDQPPTDLLGNPLGAASGANRPALFFGPDGALVPSSAAVLSEGFTARTTELIVGRTAGDGLFFEEGGPGNGQAIGLQGNEVVFVVRAGSKPASVMAPFDRKAAWTHIAAQFEAGEMRLWINGKLAAKGAAGFTSIPAHGDGGLGKGNGPNPSDWQAGCRFALAAFRLTGVARYTDQAGPDGRMEVDKSTLLSVTPEAIVAELPPASAARGAAKAVVASAVKKVGGTPPGSTVWTSSGDVTMAR
jgi:hypothetical protein